MPARKITDYKTKQRHFRISLLLLPKYEYYLWITFQKREYTV